MPGNECLCFFGGLRHSLSFLYIQNASIIPILTRSLSLSLSPLPFSIHPSLSLPSLEDSVSPLTVLATRETLYLLNEDHQWSKSLPNPLANENGEPCSGRVTVQETQPISCVSSVLLWSCDPCKVDIQLYDEVRLGPGS